MLKTTCHITGPFWNQTAFFGPFNEKNDLDPKTKEAGVPVYWKIFGIILSWFNLAIRLELSRGRGSIFVSPEGMNRWFVRHGKKVDPNMPYEVTINKICARMNLKIGFKAAWAIASFQAPVEKKKILAEQAKAAEKARLAAVAKAKAEAEAIAKAKSKLHRKKWRKTIIAARMSVKLTRHVQELRLQDIIKSLVPDLVKFAYIETSKGLQLPNKTKPSEKTLWHCSKKLMKNGLLEDAKKKREDAAEDRKDDASPDAGTKKDRMIRRAERLEEEAAELEERAKDENLDRELAEHIDQFQKTLFPMILNYHEHVIYFDAQSKSEDLRNPSIARELAMVRRPDEHRVLFFEQSEGQKHLPKDGLYYHGTTPEMANRVRKKGFAERYICRRGDTGTGTYFTLDVRDVKSYAENNPEGILAVKITPKKVAVLNGDIWYCVRDHLNWVARHFIEENESSIREKLKQINVKVKGRDFGMASKVHEILSREFRADFFKRQGYDAVMVPYSAQAGCGYMHVFDAHDRSIVQVVS